jgi:hypothetical protein
MEAKRYKKLKKKEDAKDDLNKINQGKNTISTFFMSNNGKVNKITNLTNEISVVF